MNLSLSKILSFEEDLVEEFVFVFVRPSFQDFHKISGPHVTNVYFSDFDSSSGDSVVSDPISERSLRSSTILATRILVCVSFFSLISLV